MLVVVLLSIVLALENNRRRREERRRLEQISSVRQALVLGHQSAATEFRRQLAEARAWMDRWDGKQKPSEIIDRGWNGPIAPEDFTAFMTDKIHDLEKQIAWEDAMAWKATWAAEHPAEPWPTQPPSGVTFRSFSTWRRLRSQSSVPGGSN